MGNSLPVTSSSDQDSVSKFQICNTALDNTYPGHRSATYDTVETAVKDALSEISSVTASDRHDSPVQEHGIVLTSSVNICGFYEHRPGNDYFSEQIENSYQDEIERADVDAISTVTSDSVYDLLANDSSINQDESLDQNEIKMAALHASAEDFCSAEVFELSDEVQVFPSILDEIELPSLRMHTESSTVLSTSKLVSALKGSRALHGLPLIKMSVKWSQDVYDPPVTLESHTVKGHRRRSKFSKKDYIKQKHSKTKSLKSGTGEKKHAHRRTVRYGAADPVKVYDASSLPEIQVLDHSLPEMKCGACFYKESFSHACLPVAEAS